VRCGVISCQFCFNPELGCAVHKYMMPTLCFPFMVLTPSRYSHGYNRDVKSRYKNGNLDVAGLAEDRKELVLLQAEADAQEEQAKLEALEEAKKKRTMSTQKWEALRIHERESVIYAAKCEVEFAEYEEDAAKGRLEELLSNNGDSEAIVVAVEAVNTAEVEAKAARAHYIELAPEEPKESVAGGEDTEEEGRKDVPDTPARNREAGGPVQPIQEPQEVNADGPASALKSKGKARRQSHIDDVPEGGHNREQGVQKRSKNVGKRQKVADFLWAKGHAGDKSTI
jgi:hypothetical protein